MKQTLIKLGFSLVVTYVGMLGLNTFGLTFQNQICIEHEKSGTILEEENKQTHYMEKSDKRTNKPAKKQFDFSKCGHRTLFYMNAFTFVLGGFGLGYSIRKGTWIIPVLLIAPILGAIPELMRQFEVLQSRSEFLLLPLLLTQTSRGLTVYTGLSLVGGFLGQFWN